MEPEVEVIPDSDQAHPPPGGDRPGDGSGPPMPPAPGPTSAREGASPGNGRTAPAGSNWLLAALVPALADPTPTLALAWAGAILLGAVLAGRIPLRWVAVGWLASVAVPGLPPAGPAVTGMLALGVRAAALAAAAGFCLAVFLPAGLRTAGTLLIAAAAGHSLMRRSS